MLSSEFSLLSLSEREEALALREIINSLSFLVIAPWTFPIANHHDPFYRDFVVRYRKLRIKQLCFEEQANMGSGNLMGVELS